MEPSRAELDQCVRKEIKTRYGMLISYFNPITGLTHEFSEGAFTGKSNYRGTLDYKPNYSNYHVQSKIDVGNCILSEPFSTILNQQGISLSNPEELLEIESRRINSWLTAFENRLINKSKLQDGILNNDAAFDQLENNNSQAESIEVAQFYASIDKQLGIDPSGVDASDLDPRTLVTPKKKNTNQAEIDAFYADIDKELGIN